MLWAKSIDIHLRADSKDGAEDVLIVWVQAHYLAYVQLMIIYNYYPANHTYTTKWIIIR